MSRKQDRTTGMSRLFPPFDFEDWRDRARVRHLRQVPIRLILPNLMTLLALCAGLTAIRMAIEERFDWAVYAIILAAVLDALDGRVARLLRSTSRFGAQLDSLADFVNFGVAPAILLFVWSLSEMGSVGWMGSLVLAICAALRLARFNVMLDGPAKPAWQAAYFVGVPAPAGAVVSLLPIYLEFLGAPHGFWTAPMVLLYTLGVAILMISRVPAWSGKMIGLKVPPDLVLPLFVGVVLLVALLVSFPWVVLALASLAYLGSLPLSWKAWHERKQVDQIVLLGPPRLPGENPAKAGADAT